MKQNTAKKLLKPMVLAALTLVLGVLGVLSGFAFLRRLHR
jgi:hypothetical protein